MTEDEQEQEPLGTVIVRIGDNGATIYCTDIPVRVVFIQRYEDKNSDDTEGRNFRKLNKHTVKWPSTTEDVNSFLVDMLLG